MGPQRLREIEELYHSARESGSAALAAADPEIRRAVERLLAQDSESGCKLLDQRAADLLTDGAPAELTAGAQLGPYRIDAPLGHGGMGTVFRATDTRLGRKVALKIANPEFIHRFEHESRAIAALNHPHICTLHDVGPDFLVMELVEGETLAARLKRGKLPAAEVIRFGSQIAEALAVAHAKGIVHCDLKPGNIMLTKSGVKVLDFGLAQSMAVLAVSSERDEAGTPAYMAPEQWDGNPADARTDIYALGLVLTEMVTGRRGARRDGLAPALERAIARCLDPDPEQRWQSARDLRWALESSADTILPPAPRLPKATLSGVVGITVLLLAAMAFLFVRGRPLPSHTTRASVLLPEKSRMLSLAVAPDGSAIAMVLVREGKQQIWIRALDAIDPIPLAGTDNAAGPFWSPDSRFLAFFADDRLKKIARSGGPAQVLCDAHAAVGGSWGRKGEILLGGLFRVQRVPDTGGPVTDLPGDQASWPVFLPDGEHYLATRDGISLRSIRGGEARRILPDGSNAQVLDRLPGRQVGAVIFARAGSLMALPFDMKRLEPAGEAFAIAPGIAATDSGVLAGTSDHGTLAYVSLQERPDSNSHSLWQFVWRDRKGAYLGAFGDAGGVAMISPNGRQLAVDWNSEIVALDLATGVTTPLTFRPSWAQNPIWSPDGRYVAYNSTAGIFVRPANGAGSEELLVRSDNALVVPKSWAPDGRFLIYARVNPATGADLLAMPLHGDRTPLVLAQTPATEDQGQFSPDGRWVAYTSTESGQGEIYVIPFPPVPGGGKWMVSRGGGVMPRWRRNGKELFYISPDSRMMAVEVDGGGPVFHAGNPEPLFQTDIIDTGIRTGPFSWDLAPDGKRFLIISPKSEYTGSVTLALNWWAGQ